MGDLAVNVDGIYVITHPGSTRRESALRTAEFLARKLGGSIHVISEQPRFRASLAPQLLLLAQRSARRRMVTRTARLIHAAASRHGDFSPNPDARGTVFVSEDEHRQRFIENVLYRKHINAWEKALERGSRGFIVLEDDASMRGDSADLLDSLQVCVPPVGYLDLAGGFSIDVLRRGVHIVEKPEGFWSSVPQVTNTTCAYFVEADFAKRLLPVLSKRRVRRLPIDWALNYAFGQVPGRVLHCHPSVLSHGSMSGAFDSDIR